MRAKLAVVVLVTFGLLGAVVITASAADPQVASEASALTDTGNTVSSPVVPMNRNNGEENDNGGGGNDTDQGGGGNPNCPGDDRVLVIVCSNVQDIPILGMT